MLTMLTCFASSSSFRVASLGNADDIGVVSNALPSLSQSFDLTNSQQETFVGVLYLGCTAGSAIGGFLCDYLGRKNGILVTDGIFVVGALVLAFSHSFPTLLAGEFTRVSHYLDSCKHHPIST